MADMAWTEALFNGVQKQHWWILCVIFTVLMTVKSTRGAGCEKEGPCGLDRFCSETQDRCRNCEDIADHCHDEITIGKFPACRAFCNQREADAQIAKKDEEIQAQEQRIANLSASMKAFEKAATARIAEKDAEIKAQEQRSVLIGIFCAGFFLLAVVMTVLVVKDRCADKAKTREPNGEKGEENALLEAVVDKDLGEAAPVADEEGYGTSDSVQSTPISTLTRPHATIPKQDPDQDVAPAPTAIVHQAAPHVYLPDSTEHGRNIHCPTSEDDNNPRKYAV